jgi:hypothetical protein
MEEISIFKQEENPHGYNQTMSNKKKLTCELEIIPPSVYSSPCPQLVASVLHMSSSAKQSGLPSILLQMLANIEETSPW